jgi:hypothetical protein
MKMLMNERLAQEQLSARQPAPSETTLLTIVAVAFLLLHILASTTLLRAPAIGAMDHPDAATSSSYD